MENMKDLLININDKIENVDKLYAHSHKTKPFELLFMDREKNGSITLSHGTLAMDKTILLDKSNNFLTYIYKLITDIVSKVGLQNSKLAADYFFKGFINAIYLHDAGKISIGYQVIKLKTKEEKIEGLYNDNMGTNHGFNSAIIYMNEMFKLMDESDEYEDMSMLDMLVLCNIIYSFSYCIYKHHSSLGSLEDYAEILKRQLLETIENGDIDIKSINSFSELCLYKEESYLGGLISVWGKEESREIKNRLKNVSFELFLLTRILYSVIVTADSLATAEYMDNTNIEIKKLNIDEAMDTYRNTALYKGIQEHFETNCYEGTINEVRCAISKESELTLGENKDKNIFYLEAPTGSGKSNTSTNIGFKLVELFKNSDRELNRIIYTAPFNAITTQTTAFLNDLFKDCEPVEVVEVNSATPMKIRKNEESNDEYETDYELTLLDYQMLNYPVSLISHVKLFDILFGTGRISSHPLINLFNSVVIIDEIQAYRIDMWRKIIKMLDLYAKYMNIKFIIMSATLPKLDKLLNEEELLSSYVSLIKDSSVYFENEFFRDRVKEYDFSMLEEDFLKDKKIDKDRYKEKCFNTTIGKIEKKIKWYGQNKGKMDKNGNKITCKILIEFISKSTCREFYKMIKDYAKENNWNAPVREITGDDNKYFKQKTINEIKNTDFIMTVCTQTIEAGVDIDMDFGFKDISYLDNEEQFLGRLNRSAKKEYCTACFFDLDDANAVYSKDIVNYREGLDIVNKKYREILINKKFGNMFEILLEYIKKETDSYKMGKSIKEFNLDVQKLDYKAIEEHLRLIKESNEVVLYFPFIINIDGKILNGKEVWIRCKEILRDEDFSRKKVEMSKIFCDMSYFSYKYRYYGGMEKFEADLVKKGIAIDKINNIYYINIPKESINQIIDEEYKFIKEKFDGYTANFII